MGSGESSTRKVSFGVDEEDRVRILRGVKLTDDVLQRMRGVANISPNSPSPTTPSTASKQQEPASKPTEPASKPKEPGTSSRPSPRPAPPQPSPQPPGQPAASTNTPETTASPNAEDQQKRYERQQQIMSEELAKVARKEREAARQEMSKVLRGERLLAYQENEKTKQLPPEELELLAKKLQKKDADLKAMDAFYKEQMALLEKRNMERFKQSSEQFNQAAANCEANVRARGTEAVCSALQAQILSCYRENRQESLRCSDLAKEYKQCISTAKKDLMVNHG